MTVRATPHAIITIERSGFTDGQDLVKYDSWNTPGLIEEVDVHLVNDETSNADITLNDERYKVIDAFSDATTKAIVRIYLGYEKHLSELLFKGVLADVGRTGPSTKFTCYDMAYMMKIEKKAAHRSDKDSVEIIHELVTNTKLPNGGNLRFSPPDVPLQLEKHKAMMQDEQTDWEHMMELARDAGYHVFVRHDTVFLRVPATVGQRVMTLRPPHSETVLHGWEFSYHTLAKPKIVKGHRGKGGKLIAGQSNVSGQSAVTHLQVKKDVPAPSKSKLSKRAQAQKDLHREHNYEGQTESLFPEDMLPPDVMDTVGVAGIGKLLSGDYLVDRANHTFSPGRLSMGLKLYRDIKI